MIGPYALPWLTPMAFWAVLATTVSVVGVATAALAVEWKRMASATGVERVFAMYRDAPMGPSVEYEPREPPRSPPHDVLPTRARLPIETWRRLAVRLPAVSPFETS